MNNENYENLSILISSDNINPVQPIPNEYYCVYCQNLLANAHQAPCGCRFCKQCISKFIEENKKYCPGDEEECKSSEITISTVFRPDTFINRNIRKIRVICPNKNCNYECELKDLEDHSRICGKQKVKCPYLLMGCMITNLEKDNVTDHLNEANLEHIELMTLSTLNLINDISFLKKQLHICTTEIKSLKENSDQKTKEIDNQKCELLKNQKRLKLLSEENNQLKISLNNILKRSEPISLNALNQNEFIWRIDEISYRHKMAKAFLTESLQSDTFYSHPNGYKLRLQAFPNGIQPFRGKFLFVAFQIVKGPFDELLHWPFNYKVCLSLINPEIKTEHVTFTYDVITNSDFKHIFEQPLQSENDYIGDNEFISFDELFTSPCLIKNDAIFIKCSVNRL